MRGDFVAVGNEDFEDVTVASAGDGSTVIYQRNEEWARNESIVLSDAQRLMVARAWIGELGTAGDLRALSALPHACVA